MQGLKAFSPYINGGWDKAFVACSLMGRCGKHLPESNGCSEI